METNETVTNQTLITPDTGLSPVPSATSTLPPQPTRTKKPPQLTIIMIIVLVGVAGYFGFQNYQLEQELADQQLAPTVQPTIINPSPAVNTYSGWETYTNNTYNLTFKYPNPSTIKEETSQVSQSDTTPVYHYIEFIPTIKQQNFTKLAVIIDMSTLSPSLENIKNTNSMSGEVEERTINKITIIKYVGSYKNVPTLYYSFIKGNKAYSFGLVGVADMNMTSSSILDQIISSIELAN